MNLQRLFLVKNNCYIQNKNATPMTVKGLLLHSTGANNPTLRRYVGPDDGKLGNNPNNNHWNQPTPDGRSVCVHGFIGKLADGSIATYQTLPWDMKAWHGGSGSKGSVNDTHIGIEVCEDDLTSAAYFAQVWQEAVEVYAYLCGLYKLDPLKDGVILSHAEAHKRGLASNHADIDHWLKKHGKAMDDFRKAVNAAMDKPAAATVYHVRKAWDDAESQRGAFASLENAKALADDCGYTVFDESGKAVYTPEPVGDTDKLLEEIERLKKENAALKAKIEKARAALA